MEELKVSYLYETWNDPDFDPSYGDIADAPERFTDEEIFKAYSDVEFSPDDFFCTADI